MRDRLHKLINRPKGISLITELKFAQLRLVFGCLNGLFKLDYVDSIDNDRLGILGLSGLGLSPFFSALIAVG